jgi:hypothetical protein
VGISGLQAITAVGTKLIARDDTIATLRTDVSASMQKMIFWLSFFRVGGFLDDARLGLILDRLFHLPEKVGSELLFFFYLMADFFRRVKIFTFILQGFYFHEQIFILPLEVLGVFECIQRWLGFGKWAAEDVGNPYDGDEGDDD